MAKAKIKWYGERLKKEIGEECFQNMERACLLVEADAKREVRVDTGRLRASITHEIEKDGNEVRGFVGSNVEYAIYQEYGTSYQSGHAYLRPALEKNKAKIKQILGGK